MSSLLTLTVDELDTLLESATSPVIVYVYADWCTPCQLLLPTIERMVDIFGNMKFVGINVENSKEIKSRYAIEYVPACIVLIEGKILHVIYGAKSDPLEVILSKVNLDFC